jgi:HPt (histidine-containing phosphotransfer) domain-containing protein
MPRIELIEAVEGERSEYATDPEMRDIVTMFVEDLGRRAASLHEALAAGDRGRLRTLAHQLRGSAGGYGFPGIGNAAANLEILILANAADGRIAAAVERLATRCQRAVRPARGDMRTIVFE